jgi:ABC-type protease/lipase transport system fused ATPase/permease subunit
MLVLDEPNASLDVAGDQILLELLTRLKAAGMTIVAITHRNSLMPAVDKIVLLHDGQVAAFGPRDDVLAALSKAAEQARAVVAAKQPTAGSPPGVPGVTLAQPGAKA